MPKPRRQSSPASPDANARRVSADASFQTAVKLIKGQREKIGRDPLSPKIISRLKAELGSARAWFAAAQASSKLTKTAVAAALKQLDNQMRKLERLFEPGSPLDLLSKATPELAIARGGLFPTTMFPADRQDLKFDSDVLLQSWDIKKPQRALDAFRASLRDRLAVWDHISQGGKGAGDLKSKALGSPLVLTIWGLIEAWETYTNIVEGPAPAAVNLDAFTDGPEARVDSGRRLSKAEIQQSSLVFISIKDTDGTHRIVPMYKHEMEAEGDFEIKGSQVFAAFADAVIGVSDYPRSSIDPALERARSGEFCWPRAQWLQACI